MPSTISLVHIYGIQMLQHIFFQHIVPPKCNITFASTGAIKTEHSKLVWYLWVLILPIKTRDWIGHCAHFLANFRACEGDIAVRRYCIYTIASSLYHTIKYPYTPVLGTSCSCITNWCMHTEHFMYMATISTIQIIYY